MSNLYDIGRTGLQSYRQSLAITGQNIANVNTEGYKRRGADLEELSATKGSGSYRKASGPLLDNYDFCA